MHKTKTKTEPHDQWMVQKQKNQQQQNRGLRMDSSLSYRDGLEVRGGQMHFTDVKSLPWILWTIFIILTF